MKHFGICRLLVAVVLMAAASSVFAAGNPQVYDVRFVLRTTAARSAVLNNADNPFLWEDGETVVYREPATVQWHGLIWGVGSSAIDGRWEYVTDALDRIGGCVMWDAASKSVTYLANGSDLSNVESVPGCGFGWDFLQVIGKDGRACEGVFDMIQNGGDFTMLELKGSGFGTLSLAAVRSDEILEVTDASRVESIAGDLTGWMHAPAWIAGESAGCSFCGGEVERTFAEAWGWCEDFAPCGCDVELNPDEYKDYTAAHGTWVVKYNPLYSKRYADVTSICDTGCFDDLPSVWAAVGAVEAAFQDND